MTIFRQAFCPVCGNAHGLAVTETIPGKPYMALTRGNYWLRTRDFDPDKPFGVIQESLGRNSFKLMGYFGPDEDVDGFFPLVKERLLESIREWVNKGWIDPQEVKARIEGLSPKPAPELEGLRPTTKPGKKRTKPTAIVPVAPTGDETEAEAEAFLNKFVEKWREPKARNSRLADKDLDILELRGYDVSEARDALGDYQGLERSDYESAEEYSEGRTESWDYFVELLEASQLPEGSETGEQSKPAIRDIDRPLGELFTREP